MDELKDFTEKDLENNMLIKQMNRYFNFLLDYIGKDLLICNSEYFDEKENYNSIYKLVLKKYNYNTNENDLKNIKKIIKDINIDIFL
jgi:hypothetical protein